MPLTPGTIVILKSYTTDQCPVCPFDPINGPVVIGHRYKVLGTNVIPYDGVNYSVLSLERTILSDPGPGLNWPELYTKLSLPGAIV